MSAVHVRHPPHRSGLSSGSRSRSPLCPVATSSMRRSRESKPDARSAAAELCSRCELLVQRIESFALMRPDIEGIDKLARAALRERHFAASLIDSPDPARGIQGCENNLRGLSLELECAEWAPGVTAVRKRFATRPPSLGAKFGDEEVVEVDVVAQEGLLWIECKAESKTLSSNIVPQALSMKRVSKASCNRRCFGKAPKIVVYATGTLGDIEAGFLSDAGISVLSALDAKTEYLPKLPSPTKMANLDITALFALVSEVTNGGATKPISEEITSWAERKPQHAACLRAEMNEPLNLAAELAGYDSLIAHPSVIERFHDILHTVGGPKEHQRWEETWQPRIKVVSPREDGDVKAEGIAEERSLERAAQVRSLSRLSPQQLDPFELGEVAMARTFTANGRAVSSAAEQGVLLETYVHRAVWLVGL